MKNLIAVLAALLLIISVAPNALAAPKKLPYINAYPITFALTAKHVSGLKPDELRKVRNAIYARHGRVFKDTALQKYFQSQSWYHKNPKFTEGSLSAMDKRNAAFLLNYGQPSAGKSKEVTISPYEKNELTDLFNAMYHGWSGGSFHNGKVSNSDLIDFGFESFRLDEHLLEWVGNDEARVAAPFVERSVERYFGKKTIPQSTGDVRYSHGYYYANPGDPGDLPGNLIMKLFSLGNHYYQAYGTYQDYGDHKRILAKYQMKLKKVIDNGKARFIIIDYLKG